MLGIKSQAVVEMITSLTADLGRRQAETLVQEAIRDCGERQFVDGEIGRVTIERINRLPEPKLLNAIRQRAHKGESV